MRIEFEIDELVLSGFDPRDRYRIADAIERDLASRITAAAVMPLWRGRTDAADPRATYRTSGNVAQANPDAIGALVGGSLIRAVSAQGGS
jgi:hypothetical protein